MSLSSESSEGSLRRSARGEPPSKSNLEQQVDQSAETKADPNFVMNVTKKENVTTRVVVRKDKTGKLRYSICQQSNSMIDGVLGAAPDLCDRIQKDLVATEYIPEPARTKRLSSIHISSASLKSDSSSEDEPYNDEPNLERIEKRVGKMPVKTEGLLKQNASNLTATDKFSAKSNDHSPASPLETVHREFPKPRPPLVGVSISNSQTKLPSVRRSEIRLAPKRIDYEIVPCSSLNLNKRTRSVGLVVLKSSPAETFTSSQVSLLELNKQASLDASEPESDQTSVVYSVSTDDSLGSSLKQTLKSKYPNPAELKRILTSGLSKETGHKEDFATSAATEKGSQIKKKLHKKSPKEKSGSLSEKWFSTVEYDDTETGTDPPKDTDNALNEAKEKTQEVPIQRGDKLNLSEDDLQASRTKSNSDHSNSQTNQIVISSDLKLDHPQSRDPPYETEIGEGGRTRKKTYADLRRERSLERYSEEDINFMVSEIFKPNSDESVKLQSSTTEQVAPPQTVSAPFENVQVQPSDEKVDRTVSHQPQQRGAMCIEAVDMTLHTEFVPIVLDPEVEKYRLRDDTELNKPNKSQTQLEASSIANLDPHVNFYRKQEQHLQSIQECLFDSKQVHPAPSKPIQSEKELLARQQNLILQEEALLNEVKKVALKHKSSAITGQSSVGLNSGGGSQPMAQTDAKLIIAGVAAVAGLFIAAKLVNIL